VKETHLLLVGGRLVQLVNSSFSKNIDQKKKVNQ